MGKKKNKTPVFVLKPWCWYCEREFEDEKVLLQHQKSKHFKCQLCPRKLNTAGGLMVHSQQVHKCEPEPLTNTLPSRDGYDIEIFGMEGVPVNALAEWKARKEAEAGTAALAAAAVAKRPRVAYTVIPEVDLQAALVQHKLLMAKRDLIPQHFPPPHALPPGMPPGFPPNMPPPPAMPNFMPSFPPPGGQAPISFNVPPPQPTFDSSPAPQAPQFAVSPALPVSQVVVLPPKDGIIWPDTEATPAEKRSQQPRYRYTSPGLDGEGGMRKRKAAADFI